MANTQSLLALVDNFAEAFADPEAHRVSAIASPTGNQRSENARTQTLLTLVSEFPEAFADPEAPVTSTTAVIDAAPVKPSVAEVSEVAAVEVALPAGYEWSLNRTISTFTWGQIEAHFSYSTAGLVSLWLVVGKSGTEVQSLCEAICRLTNVLLAHQVPVAEITRQLRGIRGADSEGLGPHRILGLADLIGKVLQEAPATISGSVVVAPISTGQAAAHVQVPVVAETVSHTVDSQNGTSQVKAGSEFLSQSLFNLSESNHRMSVCPECGSELHAMNGCSGGACQVCGFSSCS
jgi:hypothetical protein